MDRRVGAADAQVMTSAALLLVLFVVLVGLGAAGATWGVDSRRPGGWSTRPDGEGLWSDRRR